MRHLLYAGDAHFVVDLPDGGRLLLPAWMTETGAATPPMVATPRLSFTCLRELRPRPAFSGSYPYTAALLRQQGVERPWRSGWRSAKRSLAGSRRVSQYALLHEV
ncbi:hypothetical protein [Mesorhizobium sp. M0276]|uniref:hypothetical protein n=1 Tax=Mesorhizobium sp. M0276 TaxID=2956928 RepID=UPI00333BC69D